LALFRVQAEDGIRDFHVTGVQTCALPILIGSRRPDLDALRATATCYRRGPAGYPDVSARARCCLEQRATTTGGGGSAEMTGTGEIGRAACRGRGEDAVQPGTAKRIGRWPR